MAWARLDDKFHAHPKVRRVGLEGAGLFAQAISYACDYLTDGFVDNEWIEEKLPDRKERERVIGRMLKVGLFELAEDGYRIHDFLEHNPTREQVLAQREAKREGGKKGAQRRWADRSSHRSTHGGTHPEPKTPSNAPTPIPIPTPTPENGSGEGSGVDVEETTLACIDCGAVQEPDGGDACSACGAPLFDEEATAELERVRTKAAHWNGDGS